jgi:hypothetical protein
MCYRGKKETGKEGAYSCVVLGGARAMEERRRALQVCFCAAGLGVGAARTHTCVFVCCGAWSRCCLYTHMCVSVLWGLE